jgi:hypothetical protein
MPTSPAIAMPITRFDPIAEWLVETIVPPTLQPEPTVSSIVDWCRIPPEKPDTTTVYVYSGVEVVVAIWTVKPAGDVDDTVTLDGTPDRVGALA